MWKDFHPSSDTVNVFAALLIMAIVAVLVIFHDPAAAAKDVLLVILGALATFLTRNNPRTGTTNVTGDNPVVRQDVTPAAPRADTDAPAP